MKHIVNTPMYTQSDSSISNRVIGARIQNSNNIIIILKSMNLHPVPSEKFQTWSTSGSRFRYLESWLRTLHLFISPSLHIQTLPIFSFSIFLAFSCSLLSWFTYLFVNTRTYIYVIHLARTMLCLLSASK